LRSHRRRQLTVPSNRRASDNCLASVIRLILDVFNDPKQVCSYAYVVDSGGESALVLPRECLWNIVSRAVSSFEECSGVSQHSLFSRLRGLLEYEYRSRSNALYRVRHSVLERKLAELTSYEEEMRHVTRSQTDASCVSDALSRIEELGGVFSDVASVLRALYRANVPAMLIGGPGTGKSLILSEVGRCGLFINAATSTGSGIVELLSNAPIVPVLVIDELDKARIEDIGVLLQLAEPSRRAVTVNRKGEHQVIDLSGTWILAAANSFELKKSVAWDALIDRFIVLNLGDVTPNEKIRVAAKLVGIDVEKVPKWVAEYADKVSIRTLANLLKLVKNGLDENTARILAERLVT